MNTQKTRNSKSPAVPAIGKFCGLVLWMALLIILSGCSSSKLKVAEYEFVYNGEKYTLRSAYCQNNPRSCNSLIGSDFVAVDMNQDGTMDKITKGNIALSETQKIYEYCLDQLEKHGRLNRIDKESKEYTLKKSGRTFSIKSLFSEGKYFNEFTVVDKQELLGNNRKSIFIDRDADGKLDEVLKGYILLKDAQQMYGKTIAAGLKISKLVKENGIILVK